MPKKEQFLTLKVYSKLYCIEHEEAKQPNILVRLKLTPLFNIPYVIVILKEPI